MPRRRRGGGARAAAGRILETQHEERAHEAQDAERHEAGAPAQPRAHDPRQREAQREPDRDARVEDAGRDAQVPSPDTIAHHRERRRRQPRFAHPHQAAPEAEPPEAARGRRERGRQAPDREPERDQPRAVVAVGQHAERERAEREHDDEGAADEQADLRARQAELGDQQRSERDQELPVEEAQHVERGDRGDELKRPRREATRRVVACVVVGRRHAAILSAYRALRRGPGVVITCAWPRAETVNAPC